MGSFRPIGYVFASEPMPAPVGSMFDVVVAGNGIFVRGEREGHPGDGAGSLWRRYQASPRCSPYRALLYPRLPWQALDLILKQITGSGGDNRRADRAPVPRYLAG